MGQQDLTQKNLEGYPDVFADTINALLYAGRQVVEAEELKPAPTETFYHKISSGTDCDGWEKIRNQFHDVSKYAMQEGTIKLQYTLENEISPSKVLILRKAGYIGAVYREQFDGKQSDLFPMISIVLYWGKKGRRIKKSLRALFDGRLPEEMLHFVDDIQLYVFDMRKLPQEVRNRFKSDMRIVVDYLAEGKNYRPTNQKITHLREFLLMMCALTKDFRYEEMMLQWEQTTEEERGEITMCELLDKYEKRGLERGKKQGLKQGKRQGLKQGKRQGKKQGILVGIQALVQTCQEFSLTQQQTVNRIIDKFHISRELSVKYTRKYWQA